MRTRIERLLFILVIGAWLVGFACMSAFAGLSLSPSPSSATANSIWNQFSVWQDDDGAMPFLEMSSDTEGTVDYGELNGVGGPWVEYTIGTIRQPIPVIYSDTLMWWPLLAPPDGFAGFQPPTADPILDGEVYQEPAYSCVQPDPVSLSRLERGGGQLYDRGLDFVDDVISSVDGQSGVALLPDNMVDAKGNVPIPDAASHLIKDATGHTDMWVDAFDGSVDIGTVDVPLQVAVKNNACIILQYSPVALVGVWNDPDRTTADRVQAKLTSVYLANVAFDDAAGVARYWWNSDLPKETPLRYNVIEITDPRASVSAGGIKNVAPNGRLYISCYNPGTNYVMTQLNPLPLPYTVYTVNLAYKDDPYININDSITHFDPARAADPNTAASNGECGLMGVYSTNQLDQSATDPTNYFDIATFVPGATRYSLLNGVGKVYFSPLLPPALNVAGQTFYVKVSTNAVDGVWLVPAPVAGVDYNFYTRDGTNNLSSGNVIGYDGRGGIIRLGTPLNGGVLDPADIDPDAQTWLSGKRVYPGYRYLSDRAYTIGRTPNLGYVTNVSDLRPAAAYAYDPTKTTILPGGKFIIGDPRPPFGTYAAAITYRRSCTKPTVWLNGSIPMNYIRGGAKGGAEFRVSVSAGLNMSNPKQWPSRDRDLNLPAMNNKLLYDAYLYPMYFVSGLVAGPWPTPATRYVSAIGATIKKGELVIYETGPIAVTVHDSSMASPMIDYAGQGQLDFLLCYSDGSIPYNYDVDPLSVEPLEEANPSRPDDGSGSTQFVFRVHYVNRNGLPPKAWLPKGADPWGGSPSGVVLYLDLNGTGDYQPHFMKPDYQPAEWGGLGEAIWQYRILPHNAYVYDSTSVGFPWPQQGGVFDNYLYNSLAIGTYNYFFACSDDSLTFDNNSLLFTHQGDPIPWGETYGEYSSTGLDPSDVRVVAGYQELDRAPYRRYSSDQLAPFDGTLFVDRTNRIPGQFEFEPKYPWSSAVHPRVSCELHMPAFDDFYTFYDDWTYGFGRFFGTLFPYRYAVNPTHPGMYLRGHAAALAETSGSYSKDTNVFRIMYKQLDNKAPVSIKLWINNANEKSGTDAAHVYRSFTMQRRADQDPARQPNLYKDGCWYEYKLQSGSSDLPLGAHTYYFSAYDGEHTARWPVRPDQYTTNVPDPNIIGAPVGITTWTDGWVPTTSYFSEHRNPDYMDNDYAPGPYVNHAPAISNVSVTPGTAKEGSRFLYRATYSDADGQRVYSANITIETNDAGVTRSFALVMDPAQNIDPTANNSALYKTGVDYILDTGTIKDLALQKGVRRFYVEFTDDWGHQDNVNDMRQGELVRYPAGNWVSGPYISGNTPPTLSSGQVSSMDGTANAATLWTFGVNYRDVNNDPPAVIKLFIGQLQKLNPSLPVAASNVLETVLWDSGHTLVQSDPSDKVYSDGADYYFQTRLGGPDIGASIGEDTKEYYYAFEAYDGIEYATYKSSSLDDKRSNAAGCFVLQDAAPLDAAPPILHFAIRPKIARQLTLAAAASQINPDPDNIGDIIRVWGVYTNENLTGTNYFDSGGSVPPDYTGGNIPLSGQVLAGRVWVLVEAKTPIIGPLPVQNPAPTGVIPDAEVFINAASTGAPVPLTEQKNGYVQDPNEPGYVAPGTRAVLQMDGVGVYEGSPSAEYVAPADPESIASVEGVYWLDDPDSNRRLQSYYEPHNHTNTDGQLDGLEPPVVRLGIPVTNAHTTKLVTLARPSEVYKVLGVYDNPGLTGINYYRGGDVPPPPSWPIPVLKWQEAWVMGPDLYAPDPALDPSWLAGPNVIWPTRPNDIAVIEGVYATLSQDDPHGNFQPLLSPATPVPPAIVEPAPYVVEGVWSAAAVTVTVDPVYDIEQVIVRVTKITEKSPYAAGGAGAVYLDAPAGVPFDHATGAIALDPAGTLPATDGATVYVSYVPKVDFGLSGEFMAVKKPLKLNPLSQVVILGSPPAAFTVGYKVYIAYYSPGDLDVNNQIPLAVDFADSNGAFPVAYVKIWHKAFNPGDRFVKLTTRLPDINACATLVNSTTVRPTVDSVLPEIGEVTGVYVIDDCDNFDTVNIDPALPNYYTGTLNPFKRWETTNAGDTVINLGTALSALGGKKIVVTYVPQQREVAVVYSDMRFTHQMPGVAEQLIGASYDILWGQTLTMPMDPGTTHYLPNYSNPSFVGNGLDPNQIVPTMRDIDGGVVGIWDKPDRTGVNYFNPRRIGRYDDDLLAEGMYRGMLRLSTVTPVGTSWLYAQAYQKGVYFIDRWNRKLRFDANALDVPLADTDKVQVSYFFGTKMSKVLVANTLPSLSGGTVTEITGSRNTQFVYSVKYADSDGPHGQMPSYVRVYIDGVAYDMTSVMQGTPDYNAGAWYTYTPTSGLTGGSHTYHFEASDGAAICWFDNAPPYSHQTERGLSTVDILDIDGPWVNDPPVLTNGAVNPNGIPGGISTLESVDYTVNLKDADNDPPYVYDPLRDAVGKDLTGSPRLWVDAGINDDSAVPMIGAVFGIESDPLETAKKRVIVAKLDDGNGNLTDPNWTTDQFAGKLMQISNGDTWSDVYPSPYLRVYLIQSNTSNKLVIATETLENDRLIVPVDPAKGTARYVQFRINGLLMSKVDASQQNYALGIDYKVTVPRLPVGTHKFHFTARTRETKPLWLLNMASYPNKAPYSSVARFPSLGDSTGPTVISVPPDDNIAPVLSKIGSSTLYRGPKSQYGTPTSPSTVTPFTYIGMVSVAGVYRNANFDAHLPEAQRVDYLDTTWPNPPATGDPIRLTPDLPAAPNTVDLVQHGSVVNSVTVRPDVPAAVASVTAVYLASDPTLAAGYAPAPPGTLNPDNTMTLLSALPAGTTDVYIKYKPATATQTGAADATGDNVIPTNWNGIAYVVSVTVPSGGGNLANTVLWQPGMPTIPLLNSLAPGAAVSIEYVPWPPVYIKYFVVEPNTAPVTIPVTHGIFIAGEPITFKVLYSDANGDPPTYHDGVQGYVKIVFNDSGRTAQLLPIGSSASYKVGVPFGVTLTDVPEGTHAYHFEASDGYVPVPARFPIDATGASDEKVQVNYKPVLRSGSVDHTSGATTFIFTVTYSDRDNVAPAAGGFVQVLLTNRADPTKTLTVTMTRTSATPNYSTGVLFSGIADAKAKRPDGSDNLPAGTYDAVFMANDGVQDADPLTGTTITVRDSNSAPVIVDYEVKKLMPDGSLTNGSGKTTDTFVYRAWYRDGDNDAPVAVFNNVRQIALTLIVDQGQPTEQRFPMTMVAGPPPANPTDPPLRPEYTGTLDPQGTGTPHPETYFWPEWQARVTGKKLGAGNHTYTVIANDGTVQSTYNDNPVIPSIKYGPVLMIPYFQIEATGKDGEAVTGRSVVGQEIVVGGTINTHDTADTADDTVEGSRLYFPYTGPGQQPSSITNITITVTKPDSTTVSLNASMSEVRHIDDSWVGPLTVYYFSLADPTLITGNSLTLTASGQWKINASWSGDPTYDRAETDAIIDGHNDEIRIDVSGPSRTIASLPAPLFPNDPDKVIPQADMITPPMMIGSSDPGGIFGYPYALPMQIARWVPSSGQYFWYSLSGVFPALKPGDAMWIKPKPADSTIPGSGYPAAEALGVTSVGTAGPATNSLILITFYASHINGVYDNAAKTGTNYYVYSPLDAFAFKAGDTQIVLTTALPGGTAQVWVSYVGSQSAVDEGWIALDNPSVQRAIVAGDPRYMHTRYKLIKVLAQAYPLQIGLSGSPDLDPTTWLPLLKPCTISLSAGWNQIGNIFFNWKKAWPWQPATPKPGGGYPAPPPGTSDLTKVVPTSAANANSIGKLLGVYVSATADVKRDTNYYQPGRATTPYRRGDMEVNLTATLPLGTTTVYLRYEAYPREDVGLPISEVKVTYIGVTKSLADAKAAGWVTDYMWRYDAIARSYVMVSATASGAERMLKAWSGYWIKAYVNCQLEINPNPRAGSDYAGVYSTGNEEPAATTSSEQLEMPPPAPD